MPERAGDEPPRGAPPPPREGGAIVAVADLDRPRPVRPGEELPLAPLAAWLRQHLPGPDAAAASRTATEISLATTGGARSESAPGALASAAPLASADIDSATADTASAAAPALTVEQFPGGHSNLTYLLRWGDRELVLRRPPLGASVKTAHDMGREHRVLSRLHDSFPRAPRALAACDDPAVIGSPFFLMERVRGVILRRLPAGATLPPALLRALSEAAVDTLVELHAIEPAAAGLADLGRPAGYVERQVIGWTERWHRAATDPVPEIDRAAAWLAEHLPRQPPSAEAAASTANAEPARLLHNDFKYDNLVLAADLGTVVAVLDWEMATVGDPLMDLGTSLGYWLDADDEEARQLLPVGLTALPGNLPRAEVVQRYARATRRDVSGILFYYVFGLLKIAVIAQQIYARYHSGLTRDERFAPLLDGVRLLGRTAAQAVARRRIDRLWD